MSVARETCVRGAWDREVKVFEPILVSYNIQSFKAK